MIPFCSHHPATRAVRVRAEQIVESGLPLMLLGPHGVGKRTLVAQTLNGGTGHDRRGAVRVAWTAEELERGIESPAGAIVADISSLSIAEQRRLAHRLSRSHSHQLRIVLIGDGEPAALIKRHLLDERLAWELMATSVAVPPLRLRTQEIEHIGVALLQYYADSLHLPVPETDPGFWAVLEAHDFPGNGHELRAMMVAVLIHHRGQRLTHAIASDLLTDSMVPRFELPHSDGMPGEPSDDTVRWAAVLPTLQQVRSLLIEEAIRRAGGNQSEAARMLGITPSAISKYNAGLGRRSEPDD